MEYSHYENCITGYLIDCSIITINNMAVVNTPGSILVSVPTAERG